MSRITKIDKNFEIKSSSDKTDLKFYSALKEPFQINGVYYEDGKYRRLPEEVAKSVSWGVFCLHSNTAGGRLRFKTNSEYIVLYAKMGELCKMPHFAYTGSIGFDLYERINGREQYVDTFIPKGDITDTIDTFINVGYSDKEREFVINFPLYSEVKALYIGLKDSATVSAPTPYKYGKPIVYYGSSITQGACASRAGTSYQGFISRRFDADFINLGFSGNAKGEDAMAEYVKNLDMSVFVYDYDHNAPDTEHLKATHEKMFKTVRQANPTLPIIIMSRPQFTLTPDEEERLEIIKETYNNALSSGDKNVYLLTGKELTALCENEGTVDNCHPTDFGFASIAKALGDLLEKIL